MDSAEKLAAWIEKAENEGVEEFRWIFLGGPMDDCGLLDRFIGAVAERLAPYLRAQREAAEREAVRANVLGMALVGAFGFQAAVKAVDWKRILLGRTTVIGEVARILRVQPELVEAVAQCHSEVERKLTARQIVSLLRAGEFGEWPALPEL